MRFLLDLGVPQLACTELRAAGHDASHIAELGLSEAADEVVLAVARAQHAVLISCAADTIELLHVPDQGPPSLLLSRHVAAATAQQLTAQLLATISVELAQLLTEARPAADVAVPSAGQLG